MTPIALCCTQQSRDKGHRSNGSAVRAQTNGQMDIQTDRCYQVHYLPFFAVDKCMSEWVFLTFRLIWPLSYTTLHCMQLLITAGDIPIRSLRMYCIDTEALVFMFNGGSSYSFTIHQVLMV